MRFWIDWAAKDRAEDMGISGAEIAAAYAAPDGDPIDDRTFTRTSAGVTVTVKERYRDSFVVVDVARRP